MQYFVEKVASAAEYTAVLIAVLVVKGGMREGRREGGSRR
jgi:hypothetical protein